MDLVNQTPLGKLCLKQLRELYDDQKSRGPPRRRARRQGRGTKRGRRGSIDDDSDEEESEEDEGAILATARTRDARRATAAGAQGPAARAAAGAAGAQGPAAAANGSRTFMTLAPPNAHAVASNTDAVSALPSLDELGKLADTTAELMSLFCEAKEKHLMPAPIFKKSVADVITPGKYSFSQLDMLKTLTNKRLDTMRKFQEAMSLMPPDMPGNLEAMATQVWNSQ